MSDAQDLKGFVGGEIARLEAGRRADNSVTIATLAALRHSVGLAPGAPRAEGLYEVVGNPRFPQSLKGRVDGLSAGEAAAVDALTLYAVHQAGISEPMHVPGARFGRGLRRLIYGPNAFTDERIRNRMHRAGAAATRAARITELRGLVGLLRANSIPVDYAALADDLFQCGLGRHQYVHLRWSRDFSDLIKQTTSASSTDTTPLATDKENPS